MLVIKNGTIIDPERNRTYRGDLWIEGGIIRKIVEKGSLEAEVSARDEVIDATGMMVGPGLIDTHVHFRDP